MSAPENPSAFPVPNDANVNGQEGMTLRDWFAGQALSGMLSDGEMTENGGALFLPDLAYAFADKMLAARAKVQP